MPTESQQAALPLLHDARDDQIVTYRCPGEDADVSEAIHLGRLASGWEGCTNCVWQSQTVRPGKSAAGASAYQSLVRRTQIRRTEFGVRGAYLNAIDRFRGAQLGSIFTTHLANLHAQVARERRRQNDDPRLQRIDVESGITVAVGYDGRHGSADVFAGVVSAVLQNGCHVIDAGRCTAASLLHICRRNPHLTGSLLVTGAGGAAGDVGLDVFDTHGQAIAIPWQKFGVGVRLRQASPTVPAATPVADSFASSQSVVVQERLQRLRSEQQPGSESPTSGEMSQAELQLPPIHGSGGRIFRSNRRSGRVSTVPSEQFFEDWLLRWWPVRSTQLARFFVHDDQSVRRLEWLTARCSLNVEVHQAGKSATAVLDSSPTCSGGVSFHLDEDDRFLTVTSRHGRRLTVDELAAWINRCMPKSASHLTAHAAPDGQRVLLVDVAAPNTCSFQQVISDGLALAGWVLKSMENGKNPLPA